MYQGQLLQSESTAARRRVELYCVDATDGITAETGEAGGQPQISTNGGSWANTSATLTAIGSGHYYVELTSGELGTLGRIRVRYKSANTAEAMASCQVTANDPFASISAPPSAASIADAVWDEAISGHLSGGSTGASLNAAGSAGDPWATTVPGAYGAGTAGKILGDNLNATVSSRASQTSLDTVDDFLDTEVAAIKAKTDNIPAAPAAVSDIPSAATVAAAVWAYVVEGSYTAVQFMRLTAAVLYGKATGLGTTTVYFRDMADTKNRVVATVDSVGNRSSQTHDVS
jgi:hypothetical protein